MRMISDKEYMERFLQDLRITARDKDDFQEKAKLEKIIKKFETGFNEEYMKKKYPSKENKFYFNFSEF
ncbi:MAG: hypothetical protein JW776_12025 [Candidatus Lokiarchaeota archaeon]|nr:hypothetical protein [Candidatus Lokiarchaeota archaeon]